MKRKADNGIRNSLFGNGGGKSGGLSSLFDASKSRQFQQEACSRQERNSSKHKQSKERKSKSILNFRKKRTLDAEHKRLVQSITVSCSDGEEHDNNSVAADALIRKHGLAIVSNDALFSHKLLDELSTRSNEIEKEVCLRLDKVGRRWKASSDVDVTSSVEEEEVNCFRYQEVASRCLGRLDVRRGVNADPFNQAGVIDNATIMHVVKDLLGEDARLVYCGLIFSMPNSADQPWHQDGTPLFPEADTNMDLPAYALNVFIPLHDITDDLGPTEFFPGSHLAQRATEINQDIEKAAKRSNAVIGPNLKRGQVLMYDYRVCHRGTSNLSKQGTTRSMLYLMYARPWFLEHLNFGDDCLFPKEA